MINPSTQFSIAEKLALVNAINSVIIADDCIHKGELTILSQLMKRIDFDSNFILQARNITDEQRLLIVKNMPEDKKKVLIEILDEVANSDGHVHEKESELMLSLSSAMGISLEIQSI
ncbi:MAG: TerB family tellurite resistance protein [Maribacter sp.]